MLDRKSFRYSSDVRMVYFIFYAIFMSVILTTGNADDKTSLSTPVESKETQVVPPSSDTGSSGRRPIDRSIISGAVAQETADFGSPDLQETEAPEDVHSEEEHQTVVISTTRNAKSLETTELSTVTTDVASGTSTNGEVTDNTETSTPVETSQTQVVSHIPNTVSSESTSTPVETNQTQVVSHIPNTVSSESSGTEHTDRSLTSGEPEKESVDLETMEPHDIVENISTSSTFTQTDYSIEALNTNNAGVIGHSDGTRKVDRSIIAPAQAVETPEGVAPDAVPSQAVTDNPKIISSRTTKNDASSVRTYYHDFKLLAMCIIQSVIMVWMNRVI